MGGCAPSRQPPEGEDRPGECKANESSESTQSTGQLGVLTDVKDYTPSAGSKRISRSGRMNSNDTTSYTGGSNTGRSTSDSDGVTPRRGMSSSDLAYTPRVSSHPSGSRRRSLPDAGQPHSANLSLDPRGRQHVAAHHTDSAYMARVDARIAAVSKKGSKKVSKNKRRNSTSGKNVVFGSVEILEFARAAHGAAPEPKSGGPGLGIGWAVVAENTVKLSEFEKQRCNRRTPRERFYREGRLSPSERVRILEVRTATAR